MDPKPDPGYSLNFDLPEVLADAGGSEDEAEPTLLDAPAVEKLSTENARLESDAAKALPESPWYLAILIVALIGALVGFLFLIR